MARFSKKSVCNEMEIAISEQNGLRSLHLGGEMIQSAMKINAPNELALIYTQCMMGFLLFRPVPSHVLMIGLGGGSLAKFVYHRMLETKVTVVEINQQVISTAFNYFLLPPEDGRFRIIHADGAQYIADHSLSTDVLMIDGYNDGCQMATLCSQEFYDYAHRSLCKDGMMVVNLLSRDKNLNLYLQRIKNSFQERTITILSEPRGNLIVFAFKQNAGKLGWDILKTRAKKLEEIYDLPFSDFVFKLRKCTGRSKII